MQKNCVKSYSPTLNAFFSIQCFSHIRKVFVTSICDFLLIFVDCATLMGRSGLSRRFLKSPFFGHVTVATGGFNISWDPHLFFQYPLFKTILTLTLFCMRSLKKFGYFVLEISFLKEFLYCGYRAKIPLF